MQMLLFKHPLTNSRFNLPKNNILTFHDPGHDLSRYVGRKDTIKPAYLFEYKLINGSPFMFRLFPLNNLIVLDIINNKEQGSNLINIFITIKQASHHIIKLNLGIETINDSLPIVGIDILNLPTEQPPPTNQHLHLRIHTRDNLPQIIRSRQGRQFLQLLIQLVQPKALPILNIQLVKAHHEQDQLGDGRGLGD